jgi:hypothetical protein
MAKNANQNGLMFQLVGWILFLACAILFTISSIQLGDGLMIAASAFFVLGCLVFMLPLIQAILHSREG